MTKIRSGLSDLIEIWMAACFERAMRKNEGTHKQSRPKRQSKSKAVETTKSRQA